MEDFIKPIIRKKAENIILHVGTNNVKVAETKTLAENVVRLARQVERDSPDTTISISSLVTRKDDAQEGRITDINKQLQQHCRNHHWNLIKHDNITHQHLNRGGLHLTKTGTSILAKNFI